MDAQSTNPAGLEELMAWLMDNIKQVIIALVVLAVIGIGIGIYIHSKDQAITNANAEVFSSGALGVARPTVSPDIYLKAAQDHAGTDVGERAQLLAASVLFQQGKYAESQTQFEKFRREHENGPLDADATLGIAASLDAQNKTPEAINKYMEVIQHSAGSAAASQAKLNLARIYETQNKAEDALKLYDQLDKAQNPYDPWRAMAVNRRETLLAKHPELAKLEVPAGEPQTFKMTTPPAAAPAPSAPKAPAAPVAPPPTSTKKP